VPYLNLQQDEPKYLYDRNGKDNKNITTHHPTAMPSSLTSDPFMNSDALSENLHNLNPSQKKAVEATEGPVLILAGAGTGKTTVLTTRIAYIAFHKCPLHHILAVTFTNKAAGEMKSRLSTLMGENASNPPWLGTFHHIGVKILRRHHDLLGLPSRFLIMDSDDQLRLLKQLIKGQGLEEKKVPPRLYAWAIGRLKDRALEPHQVTPQELGRLGLSKAHSSLCVSLYQDYQRALLESGALDFGDLIVHCLKLFRENPEVLTFYQQHFHYILVDEYQDINVAQYIWLRLLTGAHNNICCVGDDDQSIYGWRGAEVDHILKFERDFEGTTLIKLQENYRSTGAILHASSALIAHNKGRLSKTLYAACGKEGEAVMIKNLSDDRSEARWIAHEISRLITLGNAPEDIGILVRAGFQTREIEENLLALAIPYRLVGSTRFYDRLEIKDALAYVRVLVNPDDNLALERVLNTPKRGIGPTTLQKLYQEGRQTNLSLWKVIATLFTPSQPTEPPEEEHPSTLFTEELTAPPSSATLSLNQGAKGKLKLLFDDITTWQQTFLDKAPSEAIEGLLEKSGYLALWRESKTEESRGRLENLKELFKVMQDFENLDTFLEHATLVSDLTADASLKAVNLMTLHMAKGLEFHTVFLAGWEEGVFPHPKALEENGERGLEEERRLAYVGLTRAKRKAIITTAASRRFFSGWQPSIPSRFIGELPASVTQNSRPQWTRSHTPLGRGHFEKSSIPGATSLKSNPLTDIIPGLKVSHVTFGEGVVKDVRGLIATVTFQAGTHKIMTRFLKILDT